MSTIPSISLPSSLLAPRTRRGTALPALMGVVLAACSGEPATTENDEVIDTAPLTIADGLQQLEKIDRLAAKHGVSKELLAEARLVRDSMDVLNGLVDQIQVAPDHTLSFFPSDDGSLVVAERRPNATASVFPSDETTMSLQEMYSRFAPGRTIPNTLLSTVSVTTAAAPKVDVPASVGGGAQYVAPTQGSTATVRSALTGSAIDTAIFRLAYCPTTGVFPFCLLNWANGAFARATSDHSLVSLAPYAGGTIALQIQRSGSVKGIFSVLMGEVGSFTYRGPHINVQDDPNCCFICACATHLETSQIFHEWDVFNATGKSFDFGGHFYNNPRALN